MKTGTLFTTMLAGAAVCALSTAPALAAPNIHLSSIVKAPLRLNSGSSHFKSNRPARAPHNNSNSFTSTVSFSGSVSSSFNGLLFAETWYLTTGGVCKQPKKQKQKYTKISKKVGKLSNSSTVAGNPCGTGNFTYLGPNLAAKGAGNANFTGKLTAKKFYGYKLLLNENVTLNVS